MNLDAVTIRPMQPEELDEVENQVEIETQEAIEFAESSPEPAPEELFTDIYAD